jgi:hypothetical protein
MVCGGGEAGSWTSSPRHDGWVFVSPTEDRCSSSGPVRPPLGSGSPQWPSLAARSISSGAGEGAGRSSAWPVAPLSLFFSRTVSLSLHGVYRVTVEVPPPVPANRGPWTMRELIEPPTYSVRTITLSLQIYMMRRFRG